ncbi:ROK family protein [Enterococcus sp. LJL120]
MISTKYTIREQNEATVLAQVIKKGEISRAELSNITKLNKASVSSIVKKLIDDQLISEVGIGSSSNVGGRKPTMITFNGHSALVIAIDLGVDYIEGMLAYLDGTVIETIRKKDVKVQADNVVKHLSSLVDYFIDNQPDTYHRIIGMSIAIHGIVFENKIIFTPYYDLDTMDLHEQISQKCNFPIFLENEANLAALGEYTFSSKSQKIISISMHSGVGAGIVENGEIQLGEHGRGGEIGHTILRPNGKACPCGNKGCLEQYVSHKVLYDSINKQVNLKKINSQIIQELVEADNSATIELLKKNAELLSIGVNNVAMLYDPEVVIINSSVYRKIPELIDDLKTSITNRYLNNLFIRNTTLKDQATLFGGFALATQNFLNITELKLLKEYH